MSYQSLDDIKNAWAFKHKSLPISDQDKLKIKPMIVLRANQLWDLNISKKSDHPDFFKQGDWPFEKSNWQEHGNWEKKWDSDESLLPEIITDNLAWENNTVVYYCCNRNYVIETTWQIFKRHWKNFLFMDDGSILIAKKREQAVQFFSSGEFRLKQK